MATNSAIPLTELLGVRMMPRLNVDQFTENADYKNGIRALVVEARVLGFCLFGGTPERVISAVEELQQLSRHSLGRPQLFSADCEWGLPMRLREGGTEFPDAMAIARSGDLSMAEEIGKAIGDEMQALGILWNFAPVADVNSNPRNPIINTRSFSGEPEVAGEFVAATIRGLRKAKVASSAKHFPGHGDTSVDSHQELPQIQLTYDGFRSRELKPFARAIAEGVDSVMLGHIAAPSLATHFGASTKEQFLPATLSRAIIQKLLRETMQFKGVIVTDAMEMHAITKHYGDKEAALSAIKAGVDVVLMPLDPKGAVEYAISRSDELSTKEIQRSYERIAQLRECVGADGALQKSEMEDSRHESLARRAAAAGIETTGEISAFREAPMLIIVDQREQAHERGEVLRSELLSLGFEVGSTILSPLEAVKASLPEKFVLITVHRARGYLGVPASEVTMPEAIRTLSRRVTDEGKSITAFLMIGSPYLDNELGEIRPRSVVKTYSESHYSIAEAVKLIAGSNKGKI
jgi:beta-glucosidase-like glycosyl hydrolase